MRVSSNLSVRIFHCAAFMASSDVVATTADNVSMEATCDTDCMSLVTWCCSGTCEEDDELAMTGSDGEPVKLMVMEGRGRGGDGR
jgi:hypothetical protein